MLFKVGFKFTKLPFIFYLCSCEVPRVVVKLL
jgi:hypothetical protein